MRCLGTPTSRKVTSTLNRKIGNLTTSPRDLETLESTNHINDQVIKQSLERASIIHSLRQVFIDELVHLQLRKNGRGKFIKSRAGQRFLKNLRSCELALFPICTSQHWVLLVFNPAQKTLEVINSHKQIKVENYIGLKLLKEIIQNEEPGVKLLTTRSPQQKDTHSCGLFVIKSGEARIKKEELRSIPNPKEYRRKIRRDLQAPSYIRVNGRKYKNMQVEISANTIKSTTELTSV